MDVESMEYVTQQIYAAHSGLLGKGLALSQLPTIYEALEGNLPFRCVIFSFFPEGDGLIPLSSEVKANSLI